MNILHYHLDLKKKLDEKYCYIKVFFIAKLPKMQGPIFVFINRLAEGNFNKYAKLNF